MTSGRRPNEISFIFLFANSSRKLEIMKCKQCIQTATEISRSTAKLYSLEQKIKKQQDKLRKIQDDLKHKTSQMVPLRIEDSSYSNQNYIPQQTLKRKVQFTSFDSFDSRFLSFRTYIFSMAAR